MRTRAWLLGGIVLFFVVFNGMQGSFAAPAGPKDQIRSSVDEVLSVLRDAGLASPEKKTIRRDRIMAIVRSRFDFEEMARRALASNWKGHTPSEQERFVDLFTKLIKISYVGKIEQYNDQEIVYKKEQLQGDKADVESAILHNGSEIPLHYRMRLSGEKWMVYDVNIEGVSLVGNYRAQFSSILAKDNFAELINKMEEKIQKEE